MSRKNPENPRYSEIVDYHENIGILLGFLNKKAEPAANLERAVVAAKQALRFAVEMEDLYGRSSAEGILVIYGPAFPAETLAELKQFVADLRRR